VPGPAGEANYNANLPHHPSSIKGDRREKGREWGKMGEKGGIGPPISEVR